MESMKFVNKYGPWAVIAGSAEGLGEAWSRALAQRGMNLLMIDHQEKKLHTLAKSLSDDFNIETIPILIDLSNAKAAEMIMEEVVKLDCRLLIYNAAYSQIKAFISHTSEDLGQFIGINIYTQIRFVHAFSNYLVEKGNGGGIILMSSLAGLIGMQLVAPYAASKAFSWNLAEAISHELKPYGIEVMACIAGATATPAYLKTNPKYSRIKPAVMSPEAVAEAALKKLGKKTLFIPGSSNRFNYFVLTRLLPRKLASLLANNTMKKMYAHLTN